MQPGRIKTFIRDFWQQLPDTKLDSRDVCWLAVVGFFVGFCAGAVISIFRITIYWAYDLALYCTAPDRRTFYITFVWLFLALMAALLTGRLIKNPAIRSGGSAWVRQALKDGQPRSWREILVPKFIGSCLVISFGVSVGSEGPSIQMGSATALGLKNFNNNEKIERDYFITGGGAAGLAAAFSAPFAGICWAYEIIREQISRDLFLFMLAGAFGVYLSCTAVFGLGTRLPFDSTPMPEFSLLWLLLPLGVFSGAVGIAYNYLLRASLNAYAAQKWIPLRYRPLLPFGAAALLVLFFPAITGEGFTIFAPIDAGQTTMGYLCIFLIFKLFLTAFSYGSAIPAGVMVPLLCLGGVMGAIYSDWLQALNLLGPEYGASLIVMGMAGAFAAAERAPVTALVLVAQTTAAYSALPGLLLVSAIGSFLGRIARVKTI